MLHSLSILTICIIFAGIFCIRKEYTNFSAKKAFVLLLLLAGVTRIFFAMSFNGYINDLYLFAYWGERAASGLSSFYSPDVFADYPPGYIYVLLILEKIRRLFNIPLHSMSQYFILKLPSILCDIIAGIFIYKIAKKQGKEHWGVFLSGIYLLNPAIILNSAVWGQIDSVYALLVTLICYYLMVDKYLYSYIIFGIGVLTKPQVLFMGPIIFIALMKKLYINKFNIKELLLNIGECLSVVFGCILMCVPFGLHKVIEQFFSTMESYPYASVNAYNFWTALGLNYEDQQNSFCGISYRSYGMIFLFIIVAYILIIGFKGKKTNYPLLGGLFIGLIFSFSVRMHERYLYPILLLMIIGYLFTNSIHILYCYSGISFLHFYNTCHILMSSITYIDENPIFIKIVSWLTVITMLIFTYIVYQLLLTNKVTEKE